MTKKQQLIVQLRNTLVLSGHFDEEEIRQERDTLADTLGNDYFMNPDSLEIEFKCHTAFMKIKGAYEAIGSEKALWVDNLAHMLFQSGGTGPSA